MREKAIFFYKEKFFLLALVLYSLIFLFVAGIFCADNFLSETYTAKDFKSPYTTDERKIIDESDNIIIFTYGPYISLKEGNYKVRINYQSESDNSFDITSDSGKNVLVNGELLKDEKTAEVELKIEDGAKNQVEIRTIYNGNGSFEFESAEITRIGILGGDVANLAGMIVFLAAMLFLFKQKIINKITFLIITGFYILFFGFMWQKTEYFAAGCSALIVFTAVFLKFGKHIENTLKEIKSEEIISLIITSYMAASLMFLFVSDEAADTIDFITAVGFFNLLFYVSLFCGILFIIRFLSKKSYISYRIMFIFTLIYSTKIIFALENNLYFEIGVILIMLYFIYFLFKDDKMKIMDIKINDKTAFVILSILFLCTFYFIAVNTIYTYKIYWKSTYDFGIFIQMFENMAKTGLPVTTCERGELLSHFFIHFSPIYYLILPFYYVFRSPEGLLGIQAFAVCSVVFPVYFISRKFNNSPLLSLILSAAVLAFPGFMAPAYFDFHENKFLAVMILWFIYFMEKYREKRTGKNLAPLFIFEALTLMIKEDAALYIITLALYYIIACKEYKTGLIVLFSSIIYFIAVMAFIQANGMGLMESHYGLYYLSGQDGVLKMFVNIIQNPTFLIKNMFTEKTFTFILYMLVPLMFMPFMCKNYKNLILLIPFVFINLMTNYSYQSDIGYQYTYGTGALLIFLFILNLKGKKLNFQYTVCIAAVFASIFMLYAYKGEYLVKAKHKYEENTEMYEKRDKILEEYIPEDASVAAQTFILPHLYKNYELYVFDNNFDFDKQVDYIVLYFDDTDYINLIDESEYKTIYSDEFLIYERR